MVTEAQRAWVAQVLGWAPDSDAAASDTADLAARLRIVREDLMLHGAAQELGAALREAVEAVEAKDSRAAALVDALESRIAQYAGAKRVNEAKRTIATAKLQAQLEELRLGYAEAIENLQAAWDALLETEDFVEDERSSDPGTLTAIAGIGERVPSIEALASDIEAAIDALASTGDSAPLKAAQQATAAFRARIDAEPLLTELENTEAGSFPIHSKIVAVLDDLTNALRT